MSSPFPLAGRTGDSQPSHLSLEVNRLNGIMDRLCCLSEYAELAAAAPCGMTGLRGLAELLDDLYGELADVCEELRRFRPEPEAGRNPAQA